MREERTQASSGGLGLGAVLGVVFIILKLCGVIHWSWLWVLSPFWISISLTLIIVAIICIAAVIKAAR